MSSSMPEGWEEIKLGQIVKLQGGNAFKSSDFKEKGIPIVRISNIQNNIVDLSSAVYCEDSKHFENFLISNGDILLAMSGATTGKIGRYRYPFKSYLNQRVGKFQIIKNSLIDFDFLNHLVHSNIFIKNTMIDAIGGAQPNISSSQVEGVFYRIPTLPEQKKIASILTSVDEVTENTQRQIDKLQDLKKAIMNELLTKGIDHTEFKDSELGRIPKSWECMSVGEMLEKKFLLVVKDGNHGSQYPRTSEFQKHGIPFLAASSIDENGFFNINSLPHLSLDRAAKLRIPNAKSGDVILTHNATVGRVSIIPDNVKEVTTSTSTTYYRVNPNKFFNKYLRDFFEGLLFQNQLGRIMGQTTRNQVPITAQRNLFILYPDSISKQAEISSILTSLREQLTNMQHKLQTLKSLKKSLIQDLLTGKVRVKVN